MASLALVALVAGVLAITEPDTVAVRGNDLRVVQWNVRQAVDDQGQLDPAAVADAIAAQGPVDVVVLSEVARGWPLSGGLDLTEWLSRSLDLPFTWGPAAGGQFGNAVLSRSPVASSRVVTLPSVGRTQGRSATSIQLTLADGRSLRVIATHLQNNNDPESMDVRMAEVDRLVDLWGGEPDAIVVGDLNPKQGDPPDYPPRIPGQYAEIDRLVDAGLTSAADLGDCSRPTSNDNCSDYIFTGAGLRTVSYEVVEVPGFDHRMLVADLRLRPGD